MEGLTFDVGLNAGGFHSAVGNMQNSLGGLGATAKKIGGIIATALGGAAVVRAIGDGVKAFHEYEQGIAEITTLTGGDAKQAMEKYGNTVKTVMRLASSDFDTAKQATYDFISTFGEIPEMNEMMALASKQAVAGVTDPATAVKFLGSVIKGFGVPATEEMTKTIFDLGQQTVKLGRTTFPELSAKVGAAIPIASALNINMTEFFANLGASTQIMNTTSQAADGMKAALSNMTKPTEEMQVAMGNYAESVGLAKDSTIQTIIESVGFTDALQGIAAQAEGNTSLLTKMFGSIEGVNWVLSVTGKNAENVDYILGEMSDSAGTTEEAYGKMADTASFAFKKLKTETGLLKVSFGELFSTIALPFAQKLTVTVQDWAVGFEAFTENFKNWREELQSKGTFQEKLEFTLDSVVNIGQTILQAAGKQIDGFADYIRTDVLGVSADNNEKIDLQDIHTIISGTLHVIGAIFKAAGNAIDTIADSMRSTLGMEADTNDTVDIQDVTAIVEGTLHVFSSIFKMAGGAIDAIADGMRTAAGAEADRNDTVDAGDINTIVSGVLHVIGEAFKWAGGAVDKIAEYIASKDPELTADENKTVDLEDVGVIIRGTLNAAENALEWAGGAVDAIAEFIAENNPDISADENRTADFEDIQVIIRGTLNAGKNAFTWAAGVANEISNMIAAKLPEVQPDESEKFTLEDIKIIGIGVWEGFKNAATLVSDMQTSIDGWFTEQTGSTAAGTLAGNIPLTAALTFGISKAQPALKAMMMNSAAFANSVKDLGGKVGLAFGMSIAINDVVKGDIKEGAFKQAVAGALGVSAGLITGNPAVGGMVYGITMAVQEIVLKKDPDEYFRDLNKKTASFDDLFKMEVDPSKMREKTVEFWQSYKENLAQVTAGDWEQLLTPDEKETVKKAQEFSNVLGEELKNSYDQMDWDKIAEKYKEIEVQPFDLKSLEENRVEKYREVFLQVDTTEATEDMDEWIAAYKDLSGTYTYDQQVGEELPKEEKTKYGKLIFKGEADSSVGDFISGIFEGAQSKIDNLKDAISGIFEGAEVKQTGIDEEINVLQARLDSLIADSEKVGSAGREAKEEIENILGLIESLRSKDVLIEIGANVLEGTYVAIGFVGELVEKLKKPVETIIKASVKDGEKIEKLKNTIDDVPKEKETVFGAKDNASKVVTAAQNKINSLKGKTVTVKIEVDDPVGILSNRGILSFRTMGGGSTHPEADMEPKAMGGYTASVGRNTPAGIVHGGEWVAPAWMVQDSKFSKAIESLEQARTNRGYAEGGTVMQQQNMQPTLVFNFNGQLIQDDPESKRKIAEWVHESFKEAGVTA